MRKKRGGKRSKSYQKSRKPHKARTVSRGKLREIARRLHKKYHLGEPEKWYRVDNGDKGEGS